MVRYGWVLANSWLETNLLVEKRCSMLINCVTIDIFHSYKKRNGNSFFNRLLATKCLKIQCKMCYFLGCLLCVDKIKVHPIKLDVFLYLDSAWGNAK